MERRLKTYCIFQGFKLGLSVRRLEVFIDDSRRVVGRRVCIFEMGYFELPRGVGVRGLEAESPLERIKGEAGTIANHDLLRRGASTGASAAGVAAGTTRAWSRRGRKLPGTLVVRVVVLPVGGGGDVPFCIEADLGREICSMAFGCVVTINDATPLRLLYRMYL